MTELFTLVNRPVAGQAQQTVNARELHAFLENRDMFANWIKDRIEQYGFVENQDFVRYLENSKKPLGGRPSMEYALSLDMAKELSMVERNAKGKQARQYFIDCEKRLSGSLIPHTFSEALRLAADLADEKRHCWRRKKSTRPRLLLQMRWAMPTTPS